MKAQEIINILNLSIAWEFPKNVSRYILEKFMRLAEYFKIYFTPISELFEREELVCKAGNPRGFLCKSQKIIDLSNHFFAWRFQSIEDEKILAWEV